ncbi:MAG: GNAT family N-acetyltransferase [Sedimentisphaerales bacterium]|nr:GNAT family N-acetyltransferase [Sedimentisphaerales bacterium]
MSESVFERRFLYSCRGYSYHGLMLHEEDIVGSFTAIPYRYTYFDRELTFALSVDTMIAPEHRGNKSNIIKMASLVYGGLVADDVPFIYGFPNELYYNHEKRILGTRDVGKLNYYVLPINIGAVVSKLRRLNMLTRFFPNALMKLSWKKPRGEYEFNIKKVNDELFQRHRYDSNYSFTDLAASGRCVHRIFTEEGSVKTLHILDVWPMNPGTFQDAVKRLYRDNSNQIDMMLYVGHLPFHPACLFKVPVFKEPQKIRMTGKILIPDVISEHVFEIDNWNVNVSNFDVR